MENIKYELGQRIQYLRKMNKYTQEKFAEILDIDITSLSKIETGRNYPSPETLTKIAKALNIELHLLFDFEKFNSNENYVEAIQNNIKLLENNPEKIKFLYKITCDLI